MSKAQPIPRKYKSYIDEAQDNLRYIANKVQMAFEMLQSDRHSAQHICVNLLEIKALAYKTALDLSEIEVATDCNTCPVAPPTTRYQAQLLMLADALEQLAVETRQSVDSPCKPSKVANMQLVDHVPCKSQSDFQ